VQVQTEEERLPRAIILQPNDGCLTFARALVRRGVEVHALTNREYRYVIASRGVQGRVLPEPLDDSDAWLESLAALADPGGVVFSGSDAATEWLTQHRDELPETLRTFESGDGVHMTLMDKARLYRLAGAAGVRVPAVHHVRTRRELNELLPELTFPRVIKASLGHVAKLRAGFGTVLVKSRKDLIERGAALLEHDIDFLVTDLVRGRESRLEAAVTVRDEDGDYPLEYGRRKIRQWPLDFGVGSLNQSASVPETHEIARRLLDHAGYRGVSSTETKRDARTGELFLIEVNVRIPANFGLADACGVDGSWRLYATLAGIPLGPQPAQVNGRKCMIPLREARAAWRRVRRHDTKASSVVRSWLGTRDFGVLSVRDPMPTVALIRHQLAKMLVRRRRQMWATARMR
jgi:D-aspartate ligase